MGDAYPEFDPKKHVVPSVTTSGEVIDENRLGKAKWNGNVLQITGFMAAIPTAELEAELARRKELDAPHITQRDNAALFPPPPNKERH